MNFGFLQPFPRVLCSFLTEPSSLNLCLPFWNPSSTKYFPANTGLSNVSAKLNFTGTVAASSSGTVGARGFLKAVFSGSVTASSLGTIGLQ